MTQALHTAPVCEKHGCEKRWIKNKSKKAGGGWRCRECAKEGDRRFREANPKKHSAGTLLWQKDNPEKHNAKNRRYAAKHPEKISKKNSGWQKANPEKVVAKSRRWQLAHPEAVSANDKRRRARKLAATVPGQPVTAAVIAERLALFDGCAYCGVDEKLTVDHFVALNDGGLHVSSNLVGACKSCNSSKKDSPVEEWFKSQPFFSVERWERLNEIT